MSHQPDEARSAANLHGSAESEIAAGAVSANDSSAAYVARLGRSLQQIADDEYVPGPTTNQWLVERGQPEGETQAVWHSHLDPAVPWTTDAWRASMFPTREAAEECIAEHGLEARAVEHGFMSRLAPREIAREALNRG